MKFFNRTPQQGPQDPRAAVRDAVTRWAAANFAGADRPMLTKLADGIATLQSDSCDLKIRLSAESSKTGKPVYAVSWLDELHSFELSALQAQQLGLEADTFSLQGVGGRPRNDRRAPAVHIERLRLDNAKPIGSDDSINVAVTCDTHRLPPEVRLRVGYVVDNMITVLSPVLGEVPADSVLRRQLEPLAEDGWGGGPVPMFVDLVVVHQQGADLDFTVVSNTLTALVDVVAARGPQRDDLATAAAGWLGAISVDGPDSHLVTSVRQSLTRIVGGGEHFKLLVPAELTTTGIAYYGFSCAGGFFPLAMTPAQAQAAGVRSGGVVLASTLTVDAGERRDLAQLHDLELTLGGGTNGETLGTVVATFHQPPPPNLMLRMCRLFGESSAVSLKPVNELRSDGVLIFTLYPVTGDQPAGLTSLAVDLCVNEGSATSIRPVAVSNTLAELLDAVAPDEEKPLARDMFADPGPASTPATNFAGSAPPGYLECFLTAAELPGMLLAEDNRLLRTFEEDAETFPAAGGLVCGLARWAPTQESYRGQAPPAGVTRSDRVIDLRWMFADAASAQHWHRTRFSENSEGMPALGSQTVAGVEYHAFGGRQRDALFGMTLVSFNFLFVIGPVVAKVFLADTEDLGLSIDLAAQVAHGAGQRILGALSSNAPAVNTAPTQQPSVKTSWASLVASDLFTWFNMREVGRAALDQWRTWITVQPGGFQDFIRLRFAIDGAGDVVGFGLGLDRRWLDGPGMGMANGGDLAKSVIGTLADSDPILDEVADQVHTTALSRAGAIIGSPDAIADLPGNAQVASFIRTFLDPSAGPATVAGLGVLTAKNIGTQGNSPAERATVWLAIDWSLTGHPEW